MGGLGGGWEGRKETNIFLCQQMQAQTCRNILGQLKEVEMEGLVPGFKHYVQRKHNELLRDAGKITHE